MRKLPLFAIAALAVLASTCFLPTVRADYTIDVSVNTSGLTSDSNLTGPFGIDFEMVSGGVASSNTATISNFNFGSGGSPSGSPDSLGGSESGSLSSTVTLEVDNTTNFFSDFNQGFTPGSALSFQVNLTTTVGSTPDAFSFFIMENYLPLDQLNPNATPIPTNDPTGSDSLGFFQITPSTNNPNNPTINVYGSGDPRDPYSPQFDVVPEPSTLLLSVISLASLGLAAGCRRLRRRVVTAA